jgi:hypothetical protein
MTSAESLYQGWLVLNDLIGELEKKGAFIPDLTYADLRNAKMVIEYLRSFKEDIAGSDDADIELQRELEVKLARLRDSILGWAQEVGGQEYRKSWETRYQGNISTDIRPTEAEVPISRLPRERDVGFFRIRLPENIPVEVISEIGEDCGVLIDLDGDRHLQVSGKKDCVREAMARIGELFYGKSQLQ